MSYLQTLSDTESEPDQTKEVVEPLEKSKPVKPKRTYTNRAKAKAEPEPKTEAVKRVPNEKQKQALEKAREIRRAAKQLVQLKKNKESVEPIVFV